MRPIRNASELNREVENQINDMVCDIIDKVTDLVNKTDIEETAEMLEVDVDFISDIIDGNINAEDLGAVFVTKVLALFGSGLFVMPLQGSMPQMPMMCGMPQMPNMRGNSPMCGSRMPNRRCERNHREFDDTHRRFDEEELPVMDREEAINHVRRSQRRERPTNRRFGDGMLGGMPIPVGEGNVHPDVPTDSASMSENPNMMNLGDEILTAIANNQDLKNQLKSLLND